MTSPVSMPAGHEIVAADLDAYENLTGAWSTYTPTPTAPTPPTLGNSTLAARYMQTGKLVDIAISLVIGSTFSAGSGTYEFPFPSGLAAASHRRAMGSAYVLDSSAGAHYSGVAFVKSTGAAIQAVFNTSLMASAAPIAWATSDEIRIAIRVELS